jgi:putative phosphoserine phosphatase/1-acylglycerol-3-phosphate O-acyltransferase
MTASTLDDLLARVYAAPRGPKVAACFDYDGTVITGCSADAFWGRQLRERDLGLLELLRMTWAGLRGMATQRDFVELMELSLAAYRGRTPDELSAVGRSLFKHEIAAGLHTEVWELIEAHHEMGHTVVLASSGTRFQVEAMARDMGAEHVLCTALEVVDGVVTGRIAGAPLWGLGKARAVRALAAAHDLDLSASFGYSSGDEDLMFLEAVGQPVAVAPEEDLAAEAGRRGWPVLDCVPRGGRPGPGELLRTVGFYGGFFAAVGAGVGVGLLRRSKRDMLDVSTALGADLSLGLAGVNVALLSGAEHLTSSRPCLFVFNHQSKIDPIIMMKLVRDRFTGVAKQEAKSIPGFGQLFQFAEVAFVDRGNTAQARSVLEPAVAKVRDEGMSLLIAPEGTRSATPRLGRFKKGAFHIAMQAGVPMVPIVIRNAGEVMWRGSQAIRQGTVEVVVHPPVDTSGWRADTINQHVAQVRGIFVETLAHWPGRPVPSTLPSAESSTQPPGRRAIQPDGER